MKRFFSMLLILVFALLLVTDPERASAAAREGMALCVRTVVPSLFPFFVVTALLLRLGLDSLLRPLFAPLMGPVFRLGGACVAPLLAGFLGGYPTGARAAAQLYEQGAITKEEAERLLGFCNNCGPGFLVGFVGAEILGSAAAGAALLLVHIAAALLTGVILCVLSGREQRFALPCRLPMERLSFSKALTAAVSGALTSTLGICAYVVFFRTVAAVVKLPGAMAGVIEMVSGLAGLSEGTTGFVTAAALTAWGGLSVHCQTMSVAGELSMKYHTLGKLLQTVFSLILALAVAQRAYG